MIRIWLEVKFLLLVVGIVASAIILLLVLPMVPLQDILGAR